MKKYLSIAVVWILSGGIVCGQYNPFPGPGKRFHSGGPPSNTWTPLTPQQVGGGLIDQVFYAVNPTVGATHTFTVTSTSSFSSMEVACFSNMNTTSSVYEAGTIQGGQGGPQNTNSMGGVGQSPATTSDLMIAGIGSDTSSGVFSLADNQSVNWTVTDQTPVVGGTNYASALGYLVAPNTVSRFPTWTMSGTASQMNASWMIFLKGTGTPALIAHTWMGGVSSYTTSPVNTTGANFCVANIAWTSSGPTVTLTDTP